MSTNYTPDLELRRKVAEIAQLRANQKVLRDALESLMEWEGEIRGISIGKLNHILSEAREALDKTERKEDE